jgi:hypothetical protein
VILDGFDARDIFRDDAERFAESREVERMVEIRRVPPGKAIGYERCYDKKGNPIYTAGELTALDNDAWKKRVSAVPRDENNVMHDFRDEAEGGDR